MPEPKDYLQVFELNAKDGVQYIFHKSERPKFEMTYILPAVKNAVNAKYCIDSEEYCTMLLTEEY